MTSNITSDLYSVYLEEVIKPQLGKQEAPKERSGSDGAAGGSDASSAKRVRQAVYDIRYRARREDIPLSTAFTQYMAHTSMNSVEKTQVREKLGLVPGGAAKVSEEKNIVEGENKQMVVVTPTKGFGKPYRRYATPEKIHKLRQNPQIQSVEKTKYGTPYEGERRKGAITARVTSGKKDQDGDGDNDFADVMSARMQASGMNKDSANKKVANKPYNKKGNAPKVETKNEHYSWREELFAIFEGLEDELNSSNQKQIKEKKVSNVVKINPDVAIEQKQSSPYIIESYELSEDTIYEKVDIATEYFFEQGLNESGLNILIEDLGLEEFVSFVFEISENYTLSEARAGGVRVEPVTKGGKSVASLKGGAKSAAINRLRKEKAARKEAEAKSSESKPSGFKAFSQKHTAVKKAKKQQPANKPLKDRIAKGVLGAVKAYQQGMERHKAATATAGKALKVAARGASEVGKGVASGVKTAVKVGRDVHRVLNNSYEMVDEKMNLSTADMGDVIRDFQKSTAPQFKGRTKKERQKMAVAAKLEAERKARTESVDATSSISQKQKDTEEMQAKNAKSKLSRVLAAKKNLQSAQQAAVKSGVTDLPS